MRVEPLPGQANVVRLPVERRTHPTLDLLRGIAPDAREVWAFVESFRLPGPDLHARGDEDRGMAEFIANHVVPEPGPARQRALDELFADVTDRAIDACRRAHAAEAVAEEARQRLVDAQTAGGFWLPPLEERADARTTEAVVLLLQAHELAERAEGAVRAIGFARRGETWRPVDLRATAALFRVAG